VDDPFSPAVTSFSAIFSAVESVTVDLLWSNTFFCGNYNFHP
jgi:hypothetical protein